MARMLPLKVWQCGLAFLCLYVLMVIVLLQWIAAGNYEIQPIRGPTHHVFRPKKPAYIPAGTDPCFGTNDLVKIPKFQTLGDLHILSAFYDHRNIKHMEIRILAIATVAPTADIYCLVRGKNHKLHIIEATFHRLDRGEMEYGAFMLACPLPEELQYNPCKVYVSNETSFDAYMVNVPLQFLNSSQASPQVAVCVPPLHGVIPQHKLVEFFELQSLLGADRFQIYDYRGDSEKTYQNMNVDQVLAYYKTAAHVNVYEWRLPILAKDINGLADTLAMHHCLYTNMASFQYLTFLNLEEFIVPATSIRWSNIIHDNLNEQHAGLCFKSAFFPPEAGEALISLSSTRRSNLFDSADFTARCLINPLKVISINPFLFPTTISGSVLKGLEENQALVHIYKPCDSSFNKVCQEDTDHSVFAEIRTKLTDNFKAAMRIIATIQIK